MVVLNNTGAVLFSSGQLDTYGDLYDAHSWDVANDPSKLDKQLVNLQSKNKMRYGEIELPNAEETVFPFDADYIEKHSLKPKPSLFPNSSAMVLYPTHPCALLPLNVLVKLK